MALGLDVGPWARLSDYEIFLQAMHDEDFWNWTLGLMFLLKLRTELSVRIDMCVHVHMGTRIHMHQGMCHILG